MCILSVETAMASPAVVMSAALNPSPVQLTVQGAERRTQPLVWSQIQSWVLFAVPVPLLHLVLIGINMFTYVSSHCV